ncbi:hypothetical protein HYY75_03600 [bacterium]|nr:hypothetical protein [bacterium]
MKKAFQILFIGILIFFCFQPAFASIDCLIFFIGTDEEDLFHHSDPSVQKLFEIPLPSNVELLIEQDRFLPNGTFRYIRQGTNQPIEISLPERDSADPKNFSDFLRWAKENSHGSRKMLILITHSWGWKGIIQDYTVPGFPNTNTMMPLREFAGVAQESGLKPDVLFLDCCVCGNAEVVEEIKEVSPFLIVSQLDTPYSGFPYETLFENLSEKNPNPMELARSIPSNYVAAYSRGGKKVEAEGGCDFATFVAIDTSKWDSFAKKMKKLVRILRASGFRTLLRRDPVLLSGVYDGDGNIDVVEFLSRLPAIVSNSLVTDSTEEILKTLGYYQNVSSSTIPHITLDSKDVRSFEVRIQSDPLLASETALDDLKKQWDSVNRDLKFPKGLSFYSRETERRSHPLRELVVRGPVQETLRFRPWLPSTLYVILTTLKSDGTRSHRKFTREKGYFEFGDFPESSFMLSEAHSQGAHFIHGIGVCFRPRMNNDEERSLDPISGLSGPTFYKTLAWNRKTGWGDLILLENTFSK